MPAHGKKAGAPSRGKARPKRSRPSRRPRSRSRSKRSTPTCERTPTHPTEWSTATRSTWRERSRREGLEGQSISSTSIRRTPRASTTTTKSASKAPRPGASRAPRPTAIAGTTVRRRTSTCCYPRLTAMRPLLKPTGIDLDPGGLARQLSGACALRRDLRPRPLPERDRLAARAEPRAAGAIGQFGRTLDTLVVYGAGPTLALDSARAPRAGAARRRQARPRDRALLHARAARRLHRRVDRAAREGGARPPHGDGQRLHQVLARRRRRGTALQAPARRRAVDRHGSPAPRHGRERTGYPTQKPRALLERIIAAASPRGGLVVDLFAGSGTTAAAAAAPRAQLRRGRREPGRDRHHAQPPLARRRANDDRSSAAAPRPEQRERAFSTCSPRSTARCRSRSRCAAERAARRLGGRAAPRRAADRFASIGTPSAGSGRKPAPSCPAVAVLPRSDIGARAASTSSTGRWRLRQRFASNRRSAPSRHLSREAPT